MRRFGRVILWIGVGLFVLAAIALIGLNLYVQSQGTQARIQQELSRRTGTTLHIQGTSVTPWSGLTVTGISVPPANSASSSDFLDAKSFHLRVRLLSLFSQQIVIKKISLVKPTVVWPQNPDGKWRLPGTRQGEPQPPAHEAPPVVAIEPPATPSLIRPAPAVAEPSMAPPSAAPTVATIAVAPVKPEQRKVSGPEIRQVNVIGGDFHFLDRVGGPIAAFDDVNFYSSVRNGNSLRGTATIAKVSLRDRFFLQELQSAVHYDANGLDLSNMSARAGSGELTGSFRIEPQSEDSPFSANVKFRGVQADQIITEAGGPNGMVHGKLEGSFAATGKTGNPNAWQGGGEIFLRDGQLKQYSLLVALGELLQIEELTQLHLEQAEVKYEISDGFIKIEHLLLRSPNIRLSATGTVAFNGKLKLDSQLAINDKIRSQLFKPIRDNFQPVDEPGFSAVKFEVGGTIDRPKSNLMEKVVGRDLKEFVSGLFGGNKSERPKKRKAQETPTPVETTESPSPANGASPPPGRPNERRESAPSPSVSPP